MSWAARRRFLIIGTIVAVVLIVFAGALYLGFHHAPSCSDGIQNEGEQGIDCGGPCPYLCTALEQAPVVRFTQSLSTPEGLTDVIAYIDNPNQGAYARDVQYQLSLYAPDRTLAAPIITGSIDLPSGATMPVFVPNISSGKSAVASAFLTIDPTIIKWQAGADTRTLPQVQDSIIGGSKQSPRITATLDNPSAFAMSDVQVIVAVFDASGNVIDASQTIVPSIAGQGSAVATFSWNAPFPSTPARIDVLPVIGLPGA